mgnify:CR=1 FL=1
MSSLWLNLHSTVVLLKAKNKEEKQEENQRFTFYCSSIKGLP